MKKVYLATVVIAFEADSEAEACDSVSAMLTENLQQNKAIIDWQYQPFNGYFPSPTCIGYKDVENMEEGEIFIPDTKTNANLLPEIIKFY